MNFNFKNVPDSIRSQNQWILWKFQTHQGKETKVPVDLHGKPCNAQDLQNHMTFQAAIDTLGKSPAGRFNGIGFVFKEGGGLTGIDLDKCVDPDTGTIEPWADEIITTMNSYTEHSVSGTGFHIFINGTLPGNRNRQGKIEMYDSKRFFVVTGNILGEPREVMERQNELNVLYNQVFFKPSKQDQSKKSTVAKENTDQLSDELILQKLFQEPQGLKWKQLYEKGWSSELGYQSHSEADSAFACKLAFYSDNTEQIRRIFSTSALGNREKWVNRPDYQDLLISVALNLVDKNSNRTKRSYNDVTFDYQSHDVEEDGYPEIASYQSYSVPSFPIDVFPGWLRDYVKAVATFSQTPVDMAALIALVSIAVAVQRRFQVEIYPGYIEPLSLYTIVALPSAHRKSDVFNKMIAPIYAYEENLREEMAEWISERKVEIETLKAEYASALKAYKSGKSSSNSQLTEIQKKLDQTKELYPPALIKQDITAEKLVQAMSENNNRMGVLNAEGGVLDIIAGLYSGKKTNVDIFLKSHSGEDYAYDRKNGGSIYLKTPSLSVGLLVQNDHLKRVLDDNTLSGRGLFARFLYAAPDSPLGKRTPRSKPIPQEVKEKYNDMMTKLLDRKPRQSEGLDTHQRLTEFVTKAIQGKLFEDDPAQIIRLSNEAIEVYDKLFNKVEPRLEPNHPELTSGLQAWSGKLVGHLMRIAGLLHMAEHADKNELPEEVSASTVEAAAQLEDYFYKHTLKVFGQSSESIYIENQKSILRAIIQEQGNEPLTKWFTRTGIWRAIKKRTYKQVVHMDKDLKELEERGYLISLRVRKHGKGRDSTRYGLNPKALELPMI